MKYVRPLVTLSALLAPLTAALAQPAAEFTASRISAVRYVASNVGTFGVDPAGPSSGFLVPAASGAPYLFGSGLWFGARTSFGQNAPKGAFITFNPNTGASWARPGEADPGTNLARPILAASEDYDRTTGLATAAGRGIWPLWRGSNSLTMMNPGTYERDSTMRAAGGAYSGPALVPGVDEQFTSRFTDTDLGRYEYTAEELAGFGMPFGLQVTQNVFSWATGPFARCVVVQYDAVHIGSDTLADCYIGHGADVDLGSPGDDHGAWYAGESTLRALVAWTDPESTPYQLLVAAVIEAPSIHSGPLQIVDNGARAQYDRQLGLATCRVHSSVEDPTRPDDLYDFIASGQRDQDIGQSDKRILQGCGPFALRPGDTAHFAILYAVVDGAYPFTEGTRAAISSTVRAVRSAYYNGITSGVALSEDVTSGSGIEAMPNPSPDGRIVLRGTLPDASHAELTVADALGRSVVTSRRIEVADGHFSTIIDLSGMPEGIYFARVRSGERATVVKIERMR